jgi:hypothetical protein
MGAAAVLDTVAHSRWTRDTQPEVEYPRDVRIWCQMRPGKGDGTHSLMTWHVRCRTPAALELVMARFDAFCASLDGLVVPADEAKK